MLLYNLAGQSRKVNAQNSDPPNSTKLLECCCLSALSSGGKVNPESRHLASSLCSAPGGETWSKSLSSEVTGSWSGRQRRTPCLRALHAGQFSVKAGRKCCLVEPNSWRESRLSPP